MDKLELLFLVLAAISRACMASPIATGKELDLLSHDNKVRELRQAGGCGCNLLAYDHSNYYGRSLLVKQQNANFGNDYFNDRVESAIIQGNCQWLLYRDHLFLGRSHLLNPGYYPSAVNWGGSGNHITSARALPPAGTHAIVLFQHHLFQGRMLVLYRSTNHFPSLDFNDQLSSFIIIGGRWTLYQHSNYNGASATYGPGQFPHLPYNVRNDQISSVRKN